MIRCGTPRVERKILRENIEAIFLPLTYKFLGIEIKSSKRVREKFQITREREPDFLRFVTDNNEEEFILHLEFQTKEVKAMPITYDIKTDYWYQEGKKEKTRELIIELLKDGTFSVKKIAKLAKIDVKYVREIEK